MPNPLRRLLFGLIAALLLLQPAVRAGAGCASTLFTGTCPCTEAPDETASDEAPSTCCTPAQSSDESNGTTPDPTGTSKCGCTATTNPEPPATPRTLTVGASQPSVLEQIQVAFAVALPEVHRVRAVEAPRPPGRDSDLQFVRGPTTARRLALLQVSRR